MADGSGDWVQRLEKAMEGTLHQQLMELVATARDGFREMSDHFARAGAGGVETPDSSSLSSVAEEMRTEMVALREAVAALPREVAILRDSVTAASRAPSPDQRLTELGEWILEATGRAEDAARAVAALGERINAAFAAADENARASSAELVAIVRGQMTDLRRAMDQVREEDRRVAAEREQAIMRRLDDLAPRSERPATVRETADEPELELERIEDLVDVTVLHAKENGDDHARSWAPAVREPEPFRPSPDDGAHDAG